MTRLRTVASGSFTEWIDLDLGGINANEQVIESLHLLLGLLELSAPQQVMVDRTT